MPLRPRNGNWHYRFWLDGREYTGDTALVATEHKRNAAARVEAKARELVMSGRAHELKLHIKLFNDAAAEFLTWADGEYTDHPATAKRLRTSFASLEPFFGRQPVSSILRGHVNDYKAWRRKEHQVREITIRHDLHALSKAFQYFVDHNWARESPVKGVEIPSDKDAVRMHVLTPIEEALYFEAARRYPALYDLGRLMLNQGCRPEEILELCAADIDLENGRLTIRAGKSHAARRQLRLTTESREICARRLDALAKCKCGHTRDQHSKGKCVCGCVEFREAFHARHVAAADGGWLFPGKVRGTRLTKLNGRHTDILEGLATCKCGHTRDQHPKGKEHPNGKCPCGCVEFREVSRLAFVIYDFRHTFATRKAELGMPVATLAAILGHGDLRSVVKYVHVRQEAMDQAMEQFGAPEPEKNISEQKRWSGSGPVEPAEKRETAGSGGNPRKGLNAREIN